MGDPVEQGVDGLSGEGHEGRRPVTDVEQPIVGTARERRGHEAATQEGGRADPAWVMVDCQEKRGQSQDGMTLGV
jgi:hypothetical protein